MADKAQDGEDQRNTALCAYSVVVPVKDEASNVIPLAREIATAMRAHAKDGMNYEIIFVDDGSADETQKELLSLRGEVPELRIVTHSTSLGQSRAIRTGVKAARAPIVITLDGDGQNDPADISKLLAPFDELASPCLGMVAGERQLRQDSWAKRAASRFANSLRRWTLNDNAKDVGCGLKAFRRSLFLDLPYFDHMHRFLIALTQREGYEVRFVPVHHRARNFGRSKYGVLDRALVGISDMLGVMWLKKRARGAADIKEL